MYCAVIRPQELFTPLPPTIVPSHRKYRHYASCKPVKPSEQPQKDKRFWGSENWGRWGVNGALEVLGQPPSRLVAFCVPTVLPHTSTVQSLEQASALCAAPPPARVLQFSQWTQSQEQTPGEMTAFYHLDVGPWCLGSASPPLEVAWGLKDTLMHVAPPVACAGWTLAARGSREAQSCSSALDHMSPVRSRSVGILLLTEATVTSSSRHRQPLPSRLAHRTFPRTSRFSDDCCWAKGCMGASVTLFFHETCTEALH